MRRSTRSAPAWKAIEFKVASIVSNGCPTDASPQSIIRTDDRSSASPGQQALLECRSSCCRLSGTGDAASSAHRQLRGACPRGRRLPYESTRSLGGTGSEFVEQPPVLQGQLRGTPVGNPSGQEAESVRGQGELRLGVSRQQSLRRPVALALGLVIQMSPDGSSDRWLCEG